MPSHTPPVGAPAEECFCPTGALSTAEDSTWEVADLKFLENFPLLCDMFDAVTGNCEIKHSKVKCSGGIFPLPLNTIQVDSLQASCILGVCRALNS